MSWFDGLVFWRGGLFCFVWGGGVVWLFYVCVKCHFYAGESSASKPTPENKRGSQKPARPRRRRGLPLGSSVAEPCFDETSAFPACPWPPPSLHSAAVPLSLPGSNSFLPLSQTEANGMRGQDFGIHQCLRETLAWSPCLSCQSCQQPSSPVFIRCCSSPPLLPAGSAGAAEPPRHARLCQPAPPGPHPAALYQNKHKSRCFLTRLSPEKAASLYKGFSVGISLLKTINIIRILLPL